LAAALEVMGITENRYSGIPTIRRTMAEYGLREPEFMEERGSFVVKFYKEQKKVDMQMEEQDEEVKNLITFCKTPRTRKEICDYMGLTSVTYAIQRHIMPLVEQGFIHLSMPEKPSSPKQLYYSGDLH
jgi:ATP-dependent DNA helicase RecG